MYVLGISGNFSRETHDPAAYLLLNGELLFGIEEERLNGIKYSPGRLPERAIQACLNFAGIRLSELDCIAIPQATWGKEFDARLEAWLQATFGAAPARKYFHHHLSHAASAYFSGSEKNALVVTLDGSGDGISTAFYDGQDGVLTLRHSIASPHSIGTFYSMITQFLGFEKNAEEFKIMSLAAYGHPEIDLTEILAQEGSGDYRFGIEYTSKIWSSLRYPHVLAQQDPIFGPLFIQRFGSPRQRGEPLNDFHRNLAASAQQRLTDVATCLILNELKESSATAVCLAGGVAMNAVLNGTLRARLQGKSLHVPPIANDSGVALGAAMLATNELGCPPCQVTHPFFGEAFDENVILRTLRTCGVRFQKFDDVASLTATVAEKLLRGQVGGWFQGRMEFGPRALGHRSMLAAPQFQDSKQRVNKIKHREAFQPVAPSVINEDADLWFVDGQDRPYMNTTTTAVAERQKNIPGAIHVDGTARIQTVADTVENHEYFALLSALGQQSGIPMVLNSSFNEKGRPIVRTPEQALGTLYATELNFLAIGPFLVEKSE